MFERCVTLIDDYTKKEIVYEIFINLALLVSEINNFSDICKDDVAYYYKKALNIFSDRAEPYFYWSIYCNKILNYFFTIIFY